MVLEDVSVLNGGEQHLAGPAEVAGPDGSLVLEDRFDLAPGGDDAGEDAQATYDDVLTDSGEYAVTLELDDEDGDALGDDGDEDVLDDRIIEDSVEVAGPDGSLVLEDRFDLVPDDDDAGEDAQATYDGVLTDSGEYTVTIELDNGDEGALDDQVIEDSVEVAEPDDEHVIVFFGPAETDDAVAMTVVEKLSDLEERDEFDDEF